MNSINKVSKGIKITLSLALMVFAFTMTPASSLFNIVKPVSAAGLTSMSVSPTSNLINELATYSFQFKTATTGTIKTIEISFPTSFDVSGIRLVEREGIGSGTLSSTGSIIKYTIGSAQSTSAGAFIRLEIARIMATEEGSFTVSIKTLNSQGGTIDGPTTSGPFIIKSITGSDVSPGFMKRVTLNDDAAGHAQGWNPDGTSIRGFVINDDDISSNSIILASVSEVAGLEIEDTNDICTWGGPRDNQFDLGCSLIPNEGSQLIYLIFNMPVNVATSSQSAPSSSSSMFSESINRQDETSSQFPSSLFTSSQDIG